jgi:DNA invertase Pin-like site-specific DNA recombinase
MNSQSKIKGSHLSRDAYLYIRQSTLRQVVENQESTKRQYGLRERAVALGWRSDQVVVVDSDLGLSGATTVGREGFKQLVSDVGMGRAGVVLGLEVSRLARNSVDWHRLLEICALTDTLILDEDGLYDPSHYNDRLLLGLKGTMSEAELHTLRARMRGGLLAKAQRGELRIKLPVGFVYDDEDRVVLHPDLQVREAFKLFFKTFKRTGTVGGVIRYFNEQGFHIPGHAARSENSEVVWGKLTLGRAVVILHNPRYAGAYAYGRRRQRKLIDGHVKIEKLPRKDWQVLQLDAHPGYITWQEYEHNQQRLKESARAFGLEGRAGTPREGPALLQGLVVCGVCGSRMTVQYQRRKGRLIPQYVCNIRAVQYREPSCQVIVGATIDEAVGKLLLEKLNPMALELTLSVQSEIQSRLDEADRLREKQVERTRYEADAARKRYMQVDPDNRLVASSLEAEWNEKLRLWEDAREQAERKKEEERAGFDDVTRRRILRLAEDLPAVWNHPSTPHRERKRIAALIIEDVTLTKEEELKVHVRFRGGAVKTLVLPRPLTVMEMYATKPEVIAEINTLLEDHTNSEVITILNERDRRTGYGNAFNKDSLSWVMYNHKLASLKQRLRAAGFLTRKEMGQMLGLSNWQIKAWQSRGLFRARTINDKGQWLFNPIPDQPKQIRKLAAEQGYSAEKMDATASTGQGVV